MKLIKALILNFVFLFFTCSIYAQTTSANFISHTIASGETLTGLAKKYHTTVGNIMRVNHMNTQSKLSIGEVVKIPIVQTAGAKPVVVVTNKPIASTTITTNVQTQNGTPILHTVGKGESLYSLAKEFHSTIDELKKWNKMTGNTIIDGHKLIVGYKASVETTTSTNIETVEQPIKSQPAETQQQQASQPTEVNVTVPTQPSSENNNLPEQNEPIVSDTTKASVNAAAVLTTQPSQNDIANMQNPEGFFATSFGLGTEGRSLQTSTGTAMAFKTASGWNDKKYYILMNNVPPGSIVRVMSENNKIIYAKVLWSIAAIPENTGLDYRISTAAAAALGLSEAKFPLTVTFYE